MIYDLTPEQFVELFKVEPGPIDFQSLINELCCVYGSDTLNHLDHQLLIGYLEPYLLDAGYFYCPYVPNDVDPPVDASNSPNSDPSEVRYVNDVPVVINPSEFEPRKGILTKYGKKLLEEGAKFYSKLKNTDFKI